MAHLGRTNRLGRANIHAGATIDALFGVDHKLLFSLADRIFRALGLTRSTSYALVADDMRHPKPPVWYDERATLYCNLRVITNRIDFCELVRYTGFASHEGGSHHRSIHLNPKPIRRSGATALFTVNVIAVVSPGGFIMDNDVANQLVMFSAEALTAAFLLPGLFRIRSS